MKKFLTVISILVLITTSIIAQGQKTTEVQAFKDPNITRPTTLSSYPVKGLAWNATTEVRANEDYKIAMIVKNNTNPFMNGVLEGFNKGAQDVGFTPLLLSPANADSNEEQARLVDDMIQRGVDAICIHPVDSNGIVPALERAWAAGIPVLVQGTKANTDQIFGWYGTKYYDQGLMIAEYIAKTLNYSGNIIYLPGPPQAQNSQDRTNAIYDVFKKYPNIKIIAEQPSNFQRVEGMNVTENLLQKFSEDEIDCIIGSNDEAAMGAIMALQGAGYKVGLQNDGIMVTGFDCNKDASYAMQKGLLDVSINPDPVSLGYIGGVFLTQYLNDGTLFPSSFVDWPNLNVVQGAIVDKTNIDDYIANSAWWKVPK